MKTSILPVVPLCVILVAGLAGCGKSEPKAAGAASAEAAANAEASKSLDQALKVAGAVAQAAGVELKIPDFKTASVADLSNVAGQALSGLGEVVKSSDAAVARIQSAQSALTANDALGALKSLSGVSDAVKGIPGAEGLLEKSKKLVSAWALKQGFEPAQIDGVLGALQSGDFSALAAQATALLGKGGVTSEQSGLLKGVLDTFGIDSGSAAGAVSAVKGLLGK